MKKLCLLLIAALLLTLCGCDKKAPEPFSCSVSPAAFSEETLQVLSALGSNAAFFDYSAGELARSYSVDIWKCENGAWESIGNVSDNLGEARSGRIGVQHTAESLSVITMDDSGHTRYDSPDGADFSGVTARSMMKINEATGYTLNEPMTLLVETGTNAAEIRTFDMDDFRKNSCEAGVAFTITFYDAPL